MPRSPLRASVQFLLGGAEPACRCRRCAAAVLQRIGDMTDHTDDLFAKMIESVVTTRLHDETIGSVMTKDVVSCHADDTLTACAHLMWERRCGAVVVVNQEHRPIAMITDRDICMAAYIQGRALDAIRVSATMSKRLLSARIDEPLRDAERRMRVHGFRRLPVVDALGVLVGVLSLTDIVHAAHLKSSPGADPLSASVVAHTLSGSLHPRH